MRPMTRALLIFLSVLLIANFTACSNKEYPVIGNPNPGAEEVTPTALTVGASKFYDKPINVLLTYEREIESEREGTRKLIFSGESREFGVYFDKGTHEDLFKTLKPGTMYRIFGVYEQAFTDKYPIINIS